MIKRILLVVPSAVAVLAVVVMAALIWPLPEIPRQGVSGDFLIRNVAVVDVNSGQILQRQDVVVRNGLIYSVGSGQSNHAGDPLRMIEGSGKFLMPGLWDMHTHSTKLSSQYQHPLFIANGITGVRDLWGCMSEPDSFFACVEDRERWNNALKDKRGLSPRYIGQSSFQINGGNEVPDGFPAFFKARNPDEARRLVNYYAGAGVDILKTYTALSPEAYYALADQAHTSGLSLAGHRPIKVSLENMLAAGQLSVEHPRLFLFECYDHADAFRAQPDPISAYNTALRASLVDEHDEARCQLLMDVMANSATWWTPTLQVLRLGMLAGDHDFRNDRRLDYVPYIFKRLMWMPDADRKAAEGTDDSGRNVYAAMYALALQHVKAAHAAGVKLLAGTDAFDSYIYPGYSLHDELAEFVAAGLSPAEALKIATIDAAEFSGVDERFGSVAAGKVADLILLDANPLLDIRNTARIRAVFFNGQYLDRSSLDHLLEFARQQASSFRANLHILWGAINSPLVRVQFAD